MGQAKSIADNVVMITVDALQTELDKHSKVFSQISSISYKDFKASLENLNSLSRKCADSKGKQMMFCVKSGSDDSVFWKTTVQIACVEVDLSTRKICNCNFLNLKQFLCVFNTFQSYLDSLVSNEQQKKSQEGSTNLIHSPGLCASGIAEKLNELAQSRGKGDKHFLADSGPNGSASMIDTNDTTSSHSDHLDECCICLDRNTDVILPCVHGFCNSCIEQWNVLKKSCPVCFEALNTTDDTWVLSNFPGEDEIYEKIYAELKTLTKHTE